MDQHEIVIQDIEYSLTYEPISGGYLRKSNYTVNGRKMSYAELTNDKNSPPYTNKQLKRAYKMTSVYKE